jgi:hypothetical protein
VADITQERGKSLGVLIGDALREAGVLVAVFGWLDRAVKGEPFGGGWGATIISSSALLFGLGALLELRQRRS